MSTEEPQEKLAVTGRRSARSRAGGRRVLPAHQAGSRRIVACWRERPSTGQGDTLAEHESEREVELRALMIMASHDLKSPLASVAAHVEMLRADYGIALGEEFARDIAAIERGLARMARLTQDLLDYTRADHTVSLAPVSLQKVIDDVVDDHRAGLDSPEIVVPETMPAVMADFGLLRHLLDNLVGNAVKYSWPGQTPRIEISVHSQRNGMVLVEVADQGIGIPADDRPKVFDAFHRCANTGSRLGTGLGLAICKRIAERHGGTIGVDTGADGGSRFWFTLRQPTPLVPRLWTLGG